MFVYVISASPEIHKIGISKSPDRRMRTLQQQTPHELKLELAVPHKDARFVEKTAHKHLSGDNLRSEWFSVPLSSAISAVEMAISAYREPETSISIEAKMKQENYVHALKTLDMTQADLCRLLDINKSTASGWANGQSIPRAVEILLLAMCAGKLTPDDAAAL